MATRGDDLHLLDENPHHNASMRALFLHSSNADVKQKCMVFKHLLQAGRLANELALYLIMQKMNPKFE